MKLKIFKNNKLVEVLEGADLVAILSDASAYGSKENPFSYAYSNACDNDKSVNSSDGNEFVAALFKVFKKVIDKRGYRFSFEPCLVVTTYDEMDLYLKHVHTYEKPELIDIKAKEDGLAFDVSSLNEVYLTELSIDELDERYLVICLAENREDAKDDE